LRSTDGAPLTGFVIAGADGKYLPATVSIEGETLLLSNPAIINPVNIRFAFKDAPVVNFVNAANLPAPPFRTDIKSSL
jgi:sialate O-acetylesterase